VHDVHWQKAGKMKGAGNSEVPDYQGVAATNARTAVFLLIVVEVGNTVNNYGGVLASFSKGFSSEIDAPH